MVGRRPPPFDRGAPHECRMGRRDVQDWLGHRNIASTMVYATVTNKRREAKYEEALRSDEIPASNAS